MRLILFAVGISLAVAILLTPALIRLFTRQGFGQEIRADGPPSHQTKRGTPSMGGVAILAGIWAGYFGAHLVGAVFGDTGPSASGLLVLGLATALGAVGFLDDLIKIRQSRNLGLNKTAKTLGQITAATLFGILVLQFANADGLTPGSRQLSYVREIATVALPPVLFVLFVIVVVSAWSNAVNFTDGLDGLASGVSVIALVPLAGLAWAAGRPDAASWFGVPFVPGCAEAAVLASAAAGAGLGFLWHNCFPARMFMGNTGSLPLGAVVGFTALAAKQELLLPLFGAVFVAEGLSVTLQVLSFRLTGRRLFLIAPLHHRYQFLGWPESRITVRFWIASAISALAGAAVLRM